MTVQARIQLDALAPLRRGLLDAAEARASALRRAAEEDAERERTAGAGRAAAIIDEARRLGAADGAAQVAIARAGARQEARGITLAAERAAYEELRERAVAAVTDLVANPPARAALTRLVVQILGPGARLRDGPDGVIASTEDGRWVEASAERLVDVALADLDVEQLWAP